MSIQASHYQRAQALLASAEQIHDEHSVQQAVHAMADALNQRFAAGGEQFPLVLGVMGGAVVFAGQLLPLLEFPLEFDYMHVSRYGDATEGGKLRWKVTPRAEVKGRSVIVLDDILDEGATLAEVKHHLLEKGAAEVLLAVFADKAHGRAKPVYADYVGLSVPDKFVVGFGMDAFGYLRNLPGIWAVKPEALQDLPLPG
ncbi:hypoxanthine-guanine phosphoribosyltransferase [Massilia sp. W12]|uniref:hypoxanthine-guanine phosphoribosyltransferase n=1 Tax=Massilia sp. W12 TaxID=3126507 RepID=UPI0030CCB7E8